MTRDEMDEIKRHFESATAETRRHFDEATAETKSFVEHASGLDRPRRSGTSTWSPRV